MGTTASMRLCKMPPHGIAIFADGRCLQARYANQKARADLATTLQLIMNHNQPNYAMSEITRFRPRRRTWSRFPSLLSDLMGDAFPVPWEEDLEQPAAMWSPRMDLVETDGNYELHMDLPGLRKEDVSIDVEDHRLVIHGEHKQETRSEEANYLRLERRRGRFYRSLLLPDTAVPEKAKAEFVDGVLTIKIPKAEAKKPKKISIK